MENSEVVSDELLARPLPLSTLVSKLLEMIDTEMMGLSEPGVDQPAYRELTGLQTGHSAKTIFMWKVRR